MATGANSYGTAQQVAALTRRFTNNGAFDSTTVPTLPQVEGWIDGASAEINVYLAAAGFSIPVTQADAKAAIAQVVIEAVCDRVNYANSAGRFFSDRAVQNGISVAKTLRGEIAAWVEEQADGLEMLGATRSRSMSAAILYRDSDEAGNPTAPIFQRSGFGNAFEDWDK